MVSGLMAVSTIASMVFSQPGLVSNDHQGKVMRLLQN
jgi:hypothetical protein